MVRVFTDPENGIPWLMAIIATAGLLGLGAPFWFDVFNRAAAFVVNPVQAGSRSEANVRKSDTITYDDERLVPAAEETAALTDAFLVAAGVHSDVGLALWPDGEAVITETADAAWESFGSLDERGRG